MPILAKSFVAHLPSSAVFQGRSEKEVRMATEELRQRSRMHSSHGEITARKLADFLTSLEAEESLAVQRMRDAEARTVFRLIEGGGPAATGATTVLERVKQRLLERDQALMEQDPGYLPVAGVDAVAADTGNFSWRDYYKRALEALDDPFYGHAKVKFGRGAGWSGPEMRRALEKALEHRRVRVRPITKLC